MIYRVAADALVVLHLAFVVFVVLGGLLVWKYPRVAWVHVPAALWGIGIEAVGAVCPLTYLEVAFRQRAGDLGYETGFVEHYIVPILYPPGLTRSLQFAMAAGVIVVNLLIYGILIRTRHNHGQRPVD